VGTSSVASGTARPSSLRISSDTACRPTSSAGISTDDSGGLMLSAWSSGQMATTDTSPGTDRPSSGSIVITCMTAASLCTTRPVTAGSWSNTAASAARTASNDSSHGRAVAVIPSRAAVSRKPARVRRAKPVSRSYTTAGAPSIATCRCPSSPRCSRQRAPARWKSRSTQVSPLASAGKPISTLGRSSSRSTGARASLISTSITTTPSTIALAAIRRSPAGPSSAVISSTSWSKRRAAVTTAVTSCMSTGRCMPVRSGSTRAITLARRLASARAPAFGW
jgi:hypothetical protein